MAVPSLNSTELKSIDNEVYRIREYITVLQRNVKEVKSLGNLIISSSLENATAIVRLKQLKGIVLNGEAEIRSLLNALAEREGQLNEYKTYKCNSLAHILAETLREFDSAIALAQGVS